MKNIDITKFAKYCGLIKKTKRAGWLKYLPPDQVESVSDHSCRMALLTLALCKHPGIDYRKCLQFAIIHDLAEGITGDFIPQDNVDPKHKEKLQLQAMQQILGTLDEQTKNHLLDVWSRYQQQNEIQSVIVKDIDKFQMMQQAYEYQQQHKVDLSEFFSCQSNLKTEIVKEWARELMVKRQAI